MYFSRIELDPFRMDRSALVAFNEKRMYGEHQLLWDFFENDPDQKRDFIYRRLDRGNIPRYYLVSRRPPKKPGLHWKLESKPYEPRIIKGKRYGFQLRVNPVITRHTPDGKQIRNDVVMEARHKHKMSGQNISTTNQLISEAGMEWLLARAEKYGFTLTEGDLIVDSYHRLDDHQDRSRRRIQLGALDYTGILQVKEPETVKEVLYTGIGHAKAFGCGLLLLRPV